MCGEQLPETRWENAVDMLMALAREPSRESAFRFLDDKQEAADERSVRELVANASAISEQLRSRFAPGSRLILAYSAGLDFIDAFFGCLMAGMIAVPLPLPRRNKRDERFSAVVHDCGAAACLTAQSDRHFFDATRESLEDLFEILETDAGDGGFHSECRWSPEPDRVAYLQYTSGSTGNPRGAIISHRNLMANLEMIGRGFDFTDSEQLVSWLPHYHDMGLVGDTLSPLYSRIPCVKMSPQSFMREPLSWLRAVTKYRATAMGAPNFAYDLCARAASRDNTHGLDLQSVVHAYCGAEPIQPDTLYRFRNTFSSFGFKPNSFRPCYGLAEATLCVTVEQKLAALKLRPRPAGNGANAHPGRLVVGCGRPIAPGRVQIVDEQTSDPLPDGAIGEVLISGPNITCGYWNEVDVVEGRIIAEPTLEPLRTGDLGFMESGELYVTGRKKDMMIIGGRNHYPQDVERSAMRAHEAVEGCVSFAVESDEGEKIVAVAEVSRCFRNRDLSPVRRAIQQAVLEENDVSISDLVFVSPLSIPRTSSGKVRRFACREHYASRSVPGMIQNICEPGEAIIEDHSHQVTNYLRRWASKNLGLEPASITNDSRLSELGLDSLRAVDLQLSLNRDCGVSVSPCAFADGVSVGELAQRAIRFVAPAGPPRAVIPAEETVHLRFNVMPSRFVQEDLYTKEYRIWTGYAEAIFDREYKSEMVASPDHLIFLTALTHTQKLAYVYMAHELGISHDPNTKERFKFWPTDVRVTMPQMVTENANLRQQMWVYDKRHVSGNKYQVKCRSLIASMEILIDSTMLMLEGN